MKGAKKGCVKLLLPTEVIKVLEKLLKWHECYLVGGGVRDLFLKRKLSDLDIILPGAEDAFRKISLQDVGAKVNLGEKNGQACYRIIFSKDCMDGIRSSSENLEDVNTYDQFWIDLVTPRSGDLLSDLAARDFTINAMALPLEVIVKMVRGEILFNSIVDDIIDPLQGCKDLNNKILREVSPSLFQEDPLRLWRLWRLAAELGFTPTDMLFKLASQNSHLCQSIPGERIRNELFSLLKAPMSAEALLEVASCGLLENQFPDFKYLKNCLQNGYHYQDVWDHSFQTLIELEKIIVNIAKYFPKAVHQKIIKDWLNSNLNCPIVKLSALFHDIGKPQAKKTSSDGNIHFYGHDQISLSVVKNIAERLRFSSRDNKLLGFLIERHLQIHSIIKGAAFRTQVRFWRKYGEDTVGLVLLGCADMLAKAKVHTHNTSAEAYFTKYIPEFFDIWLNSVQVAVNIKPLLDGKDIMALFNLPPGMQVGYLKESVREAQIEGIITTRFEAIAFAASLLDKPYLKNFGDY